MLETFADVRAITRRAQELNDDRAGTWDVCAGTVIEDLADGLQLAGPQAVPWSFEESSAAVLTAWNPGGRTGTPEYNRQQQAELLAGLDKDGVALREVVGRSPDGLCGRNLASWCSGCGSNRPSSSAAGIGK